MFQFAHCTCSRYKVLAIIKLKKRSGGTGTGSRKNNMNKNRGSILISHLLAAGFIGISTVALLSYMQGMHSKTQEIEQEQDISFNIHSNIIFSLRALLVSATIDKDGKEQDQNKEGICSLLKRPNRSSGVELIQFNLGSNLSAQARASFSEDRWEVFFDKSEYEISSSTTPCTAMDPGFASNEFSRCFKYIGKKDETANEAYVIARIVLKQFPGLTVIDLSQPNTLDVKTVLFELQSWTAVFEGNDYSSTGISPSKQYGMIWANSVSECHITSTNNKKVVVQFSGSGLGRLSARTLINNSRFSDVTTCNELEFLEIVPRVKSSITTSDAANNEIAKDQNSKARLACRSKIFRCKDENSHSSDDYEPIIFTIGLTNSSGGSLDLKKMKLTFVDENSVEVPSGRPGQLTVEVYDQARDFDANEALSNVPIGIGIRGYKITVKDKNSGSLQGFCDEACSLGKQIFPLFKVDLNKASGAPCTSYSSSYTDEDKNRFRCIVCHSKICTKFGMGAFGPIRDSDGLQGLVDEPLDGTIPECKLPANNTSGDYDLPSSITAGSGDCVVMTGLSAKDDFKFVNAPQYAFRSCSSQRPVLCFVYGHYIPAVELSSPTSNPVIATSNFEGAQKACYNMGRELVKKTDLGGFFQGFWSHIAGNTKTAVAAGLGLDPFSGNANYFDYVNNAARGIFIAPSYNIGAISKILKDGYIKKFIDGPYSEAWVAMRNDGGGQLIGSIPWAEIASSEVAIFRRKEDPFPAVLLKNTNIISSSGTGKTDTALTHNIQYKGVYNVDGSSGTRKALCRKTDSSGKFEELKLSASTSLADAPTACITAGAKFLPPVNSLEWVKAMTLLKKNHEVYPFPDPGNLSGDTSHIYSLSVNARSVWVALSRKTGNGSSTEAWRLSDLYFPDITTPTTVKSIFRHTEENDIDKLLKKGFYTTPTSSKYIGIIDDKGRPFIPSSVTKYSVRSSSFLNPYKVACYTEDGNDQVTLVAAKTSCGSVEKEVTKTWLYGKGRKSVKFMSEWIEKNISGNILIDREAIGELKQRAENLYCKSPFCPNCVSSCNNGQCETTRRDCRRDCPYSCSTDVPGPPIPDAACITACGTDTTCAGACGTVPGPDITIAIQCSSCLSGCNSTANTCKAECRSDNCYTCGTPPSTNCTEQCDCQFPLELSSPPDPDGPEKHDWTTTVLP